jgi:hypothetical protein
MMAFEGLFLSGWCDAEFEGQVFEVLTGGGGGELADVLIETAHAEAGESSDPPEVGLFSRDGETSEPDGLGALEEEFGDGLFFSGSGSAVDFGLGGRIEGCAGVAVGDGFGGDLC